MNKSDTAKNLYSKGYLCSQAVFATFCEDLGITKDLGLKLSNFLAFGFNFRADYCGAVSAALMIYSLKYSSGETYNELSNEVFYKLSQEHIKKFTDKHGSCLCKELLKADLSTEEGMAYLRENNLFNTRCPLFVEDSTKILTEQILEMNERISKTNKI